jgi:hypothetical protein
VDFQLNGASKVSVDSTCKGYRRAALLQRLREGNTNMSNAKERRLVQVQLHNECCEESGTRIDLNKQNMNLGFRQTVNHTDDLRYAGVKIRDLEKHILEHERREKH